ncbi:MAG: calcium:proton antiporter [Verrucomicrobiota bacterium]
MSDSFKPFYRAELSLIIGLISAGLFLLFGKGWLADLSNLPLTLFLFVWLFAVMLWSSFGVVKHADCLAIKLGEPYGTLILTLSVITIEVIMVSAVMLTGSENPTLGRDMMFAVVMIVLNGLVGLCLFIGGLKHHQQEFNLQGANVFLSVLIPLAVLGLLLPNFTKATEPGTFSTSQAIFIIVATAALYGAFLAIQTMRHRPFFMAPTNGDGDDHDDHGNLEIRSIPYHVALLVLSMVPIVLLSKKIAVIIDHGIANAGAPAALGGFLVAILVLAPEAMAAIKASLQNRLQRSMNICLGSALATIGLTVPAVLLIGMFTGKKVVLGLSPVGEILLVLTLAVSAVNFSAPRTNVVQGLIHLILFSTYCLLIFD